MDGYRIIEKKKNEKKSS